MFICLFMVGFCSFHMTAGALPLDSLCEKKISGKMTCLYQVFSWKKKNCLSVSPLPHVIHIF